MGSSAGYGWFAVGAALAWLLINAGLIWTTQRRAVPLHLVLAVGGVTMAGVIATLLLDRRRPANAGDIALSLGLWLLYMAIVCAKARSQGEPR